MAKAKPKKAPSLQVFCWAGTPHELETKLCNTPAGVKTFLRGRIRAREEWAARYNTATKRQLERAREELDALNVQTVNVGSKREWTAVDDYSGVKFVHGFEVRAK